MMYIFPGVDINAMRAAKRARLNNRVRGRATRARHADRERLLKLAKTMYMTVHIISSRWPAPSLCELSPPPAGA